MSSPGSGSSVTRVTSDKLRLIPPAPLTGDTGRPLMFSDD